jgi:hypothetical protein
VNLVTNIGAGPAGTHGEAGSNVFKPAQPLGRVLRAPRAVEADGPYDRALERLLYSGVLPHSRLRRLAWALRDRVYRWTGRR